MAKKILPAGWADEYAGFEGIFDTAVDGHWEHARLGLSVTRWADDLSLTWTGSGASGREMTLAGAMQAAEMGTGRFLRIT